MMYFVVSQQTSMTQMSGSHHHADGAGNLSASSSLSSNRSGSALHGFKPQNDKNLGNSQQPRIFGKWTEELHHFVLNGLFRECKVIFQQEEIEYGGPVYKRVLFQFKDGLADPKNRFDLALYQPKEWVVDWWNNHAVPIIHKKLMGKNQITWRKSGGS